LVFICQRYQRCYSYDDSVLVIWSNLMMNRMLKFLFYFLSWNKNIVLRLDITF
jgi:hypothetical protein